MKFYNLVPRFVAAHQFDTMARTVQPAGQEPNQCFVGRRLHRRRGDSDSQLAARPVIRHNFIGGRARLDFYGKQDAVHLRMEETGKLCRMNWINGFLDWWIVGQGTFYVAINPFIQQPISFVLRSDEPEDHGRHCKADGED